MRREVTFMRGRELTPADAAAVRLQVSQTLQDNAAEQSRLAKRLAGKDRLPPERRETERAVLTVEAALVKAFCVLERSLPGEGVRGTSGRNGPDYLRDEQDQYLAGKWLGQAPRPALPTSKEISAAEEAKLWVRYLDERAARVLTVGAMSKRGDVGRRVNWDWVRTRLPELRHHYTTRGLQAIYTGALREIVIALAGERLSA